MTRKEFRKKTSELVWKAVDMLGNVTDGLYDSRVVDTEKFDDDDFLLPKILLTVAAKRVFKQFRPLSDEGQKEVKRIESSNY